MDLHVPIASCLLTFLAVSMQHKKWVAPRLG